MNPHWNLCVSSLFTHAGPSQPPCAACSSWDHRDMMWIRPLDRCPCHEGSASPPSLITMALQLTCARVNVSLCEHSGLRDRAVSTNPFSANLVCVSEFGLAAVLRVRDHQNCWFPGAAGGGCSFLSSLVCHSWHSQNIKDVARAEWFMCCPVKWCGSFAKHWRKKEPHNLALMRAHSRGGNKSPQTSRFECVH